MERLTKIAVALVLLAACVFYGVDSTCFPKPRRPVYDCERVIITSLFCGKKQTMDGCFNKYRYNNFTSNFFLPPTVVVGIESWDVSREANARLNIIVTKVTRKLAEIRIVTWLDSHSFSVRTTLLACGYMYPK